MGNKTNTKKIIKIIAIITAVVLLLSGALSVYFLFFHRYKGKEVNSVWTKEDEFSIDNIVTLKKEKGKDFVILNLTDIQLCDTENFFNKTIIKKEIDFLIKKSNPDLITLTGDQTWSNENLISLKSLISWLESYKIPYAPVFGNHDHGNEYNSAVASLNYCCDLYEKAEHCLFKRGPTNLGSLGNYVINIVEEDKIFKTIYMLDAGYNDIITASQIEWVKWNAEGIRKNNDGKYAEGMCFMHKPIPQFATSYYNYLSGNAVSSVNVLVNCSLIGVYETGFYDVAKSCNINYFTAGHQHTNSFSISFDSSVFTFALKTGELSFYYDDGNVNYNGGTVFTLGNDVKINNIYVNRDDFHIKGSKNTFNG